MRRAPDVHPWQTTSLRTALFPYSPCCPLAPGMSSSHATVTATLGPTSPHASPHPGSPSLRARSEVTERKGRKDKQKHFCERQAPGQFVDRYLPSEAENGLWLGLKSNTQNGGCQLLYSKNADLKYRSHKNILMNTGRSHWVGHKAVSYCVVRNVNTELITELLSTWCEATFSARLTSENPSCYPGR